MSQFKSYRRWPFASLLTSHGSGAGSHPAVSNPCCLGPRLCMALLRGDNAEAEQLLHCGAPVNFRDEPDGWTPLIYSIYYDNPEGRALLFRFGADPKLGDHSGRTALMFAAMNGDLTLVTDLLARGVDPLACDKLGRTACDYAMLYRHRRCTAELLKYAANADAEPLAERR